MEGGAAVDETQDLLRAIMGRLDEMSAELKGVGVRIQESETRLRGEMEGLRGEIQASETRLRGEMEGLRGEMEGLRGELAALRADSNKRLESIEDRLDYFFAKWAEHDEALHKLKRRQA